MISTVQSDFSGGVVRAVPPELIPGNGAYDLQNLLLDDDGSAYKRGGSSFRSGSGTGAAGLLWVADETLYAGARTVFYAASFFSALAGDDSTVVTIGGGSTDGQTLWRPILVAGLLIHREKVYAGGRGLNPNTPGTATVTNGSKTVTGAGTNWLAGGAEKGQFFTPTGAGDYTVLIESVDSATQLTLDRPYPGPTTGGLAHLFDNQMSGFWNGSAGASVGGALDPYNMARHPQYVASAAGRVFVARGRRVRFCGAFTAGGAGFFAPGATAWATNDFYDFPADVIGMTNIRNTLAVFTTAGVYLVSGLELDLVDDFGNTQHRVELLTDQIVLLGGGIASYGDAAVVPAVDGVWLVGTAGGPQALSRSIKPLWESYVAAGYTTGEATVFGQQLLLPIVNSSNAVQDVLVCRLDRPYAGPTGTWWPWSRLGNAGAANASGFATRRRPGAAPKLLAASRAASSRVWDCDFFNRDTGGLDADGSVISATIQTRGFRGAGTNQKALLRKVRLQQQLVSASATADIQLTITEPEGTTISPTQQAPEEAGGDAYVWMPTGSACRSFYSQLTFTLAERSEKWKVKAVECFYREPGKL